MSLNPAPSSIDAARRSRRAGSGSGLYYYGYRYYNPTTGRWLSRDPIGEEGGLNFYRASDNSWVNQTDIFGLEPEPNKEPAVVDPCPRPDIDGKSCDECCKECRKHGTHPTIVDNETNGQRIKLRVQGLRFESIPTKDCASKYQSPDCCRVVYCWYNCYTRDVRPRGSSIDVLVPPAPPANINQIENTGGWRAIVWSIPLWWWCSCEKGKRNCKKNTAGSERIVFVVDDWRKGKNANWKLVKPEKRPRIVVPKYT